MLRPQTCTRITDLKDFNKIVNNKLQTFSTNDNTLASVSFAYIEALTLFELLNLKPKFIKILGEGAFNVVIEISLEIPKDVRYLSNLYFNISKLKDIKDSRFALRLSKNENSTIMNASSNAFTYYSNYNMFNSICLNIYYSSKPKNYIFDSYNLVHYVDSHEDDTLNIFTHYSLLPIYKEIDDKNYKLYRYAYIKTLQKEIEYFNDKNELRYFDWKISNFMIDTTNDTLVLTDTDLLNVITINNELCSSHRLYPDPTIGNKVFNVGYSNEKNLRSMLYMYISYYLSIDAVCKCTTLDKYYKSFQHITSFDDRINKDKTIASVIRITSNTDEPCANSKNKHKILTIIDNIKKAADELINSFKL